MFGKGIENRRFRMAEYLSKEEIKQWRSSLEKITLEEFAQRLGKQVADSRPTNDMVDIIYNGETTFSSRVETSDKISEIAQRAFARERQLSHTPFSFRAPGEDAVVKSESKSSNSSSKSMESKKIVEAIEKVIPAEVTNEPKAPEKDLREEVNIVLKKNLTDREQTVFDYLLERRNTIVYAKDIAALLDLPRDYVYKYIKNLRAKIEGDKLVNAEKGGFILTV